MLWMRQDGSRQLKVRVRMHSRLRADIETFWVIGIWMCKAKNANLLVMDVEGTDGRERGEDQVRLAPPQCVSTSNVPIGL